MVKRGPKRAQITIFIVMALALVGIVILFVVLRGRVGVGLELPPSDQDPELFIQSCVNPELLEIADTLAKQGGTYRLEGNESLALTIDGQRMAYLCFTTNYFYPCVNQQPMLFAHLKQELHDAVEEKVDDCFNQLEEDLKEHKYDVDLRGDDFSVSLGPNKIILDYDRELTISRQGSAPKRFDQFKGVARHPLYDLGIVAQEIASQEAEYCSFETTGYALLYPQFAISRFRTGDLKTIYSIIHEPSGKEFNFAIRSCIIPPGF